MPWTDQHPDATDIIVRHIGRPKALAHLEIDKLDDGTYRLTAGNLFHSEEVLRDRDLESVLRTAERMREKLL